MDSSPLRPLKEKEQIQFDIPMDNPESCMRKYKSLREAQKLHRLNDINYRLEILKKIQFLWDKYAKDVELSNYLDLGITELNNVLTNYCLVRSEIDFAINNLKSWTKPRSMDTPISLSTTSSYIQPEPYGLVLIFSAWNCNFLTLIIPLVQAIAAGNLVIAKPSLMSPETSKVCLKILNELPHDIVYGIGGEPEPEIYSELLKYRWDLIVFTGSSAKGKIIAKAAAEFLTPTILELGGQNPAIVEKSANITSTANNLLYGRHTVTGQACVAPEYIFVERSIKEKLIEELKKTFDKHFTKNPETSPELGKIITDHHTKRLKNLVENPGPGATLLYGDLSKINLEKKFIPPFLFGFDSIDTMAKSALAQGEIFGPILYLCPYDKIEDVVDYINQREKPLAEYLFTNNKTIKNYVKDNTSSGALVFNDCLIHFSSPFLPFGGVGNSGMNAYHGKWGFDNMSHLKPVVDQTSFYIPMRYPPFGVTQVKLMQFLLTFRYSTRQVLKFSCFIAVMILFICFCLPKIINRMN